MMKIESAMIILACSKSSVVRADKSVDETSIAAMVKEQVHLQMAQLHNEMVKKDETIAALTAALQSKTEHRQVQLKAGGEVMQLVSKADLEEVAERVAACEKTNTDQDAKLGMTMDTVTKVLKEIKDGRVGAPPALPPASPPRLLPPQPVAKPGRRLRSSSNGNFVNELSITGPNAVLSWNSHTPELTSFNCTGVGDGSLSCSGEMIATDFVVQGNTMSEMLLRIDRLAADVTAAIDRQNPSFDFEYGFASQDPQPYILPLLPLPGIRGCPRGWVCTGDVTVRTESVLPVFARSHGSQEGSYFLYVGDDGASGTATSTYFHLPAGATSMKYLHAGGADGPNGLYLLGANGNMLASGTRTTNTNVFDRITVPLHGHLNESMVYLSAVKSAETNWHKLMIDDIHFLDAW
eukprot:CAMPEP_0119298840 /NCGR_PEP_ID=MMETSP1333-20130426/963_1 /TAXON_ID=418940 /ORGANISM="Scyphosphaera apsteinii, Strain RCC1455" /LENGTH=406 /DNA_ID=CAMNT_0007300049 /DNA_START=31 /DNA_END=1248 /DNA_ORIENTATION=-